MDFTNPTPALTVSEFTTLGPALPEKGDTVDVILIDQQHPEYKVQVDTWQKLELLYASGWALKRAAEQFLSRRPKEQPDVFQARINEFMHVNHLGTALDWYCSELFEEDPHIEPVIKDKKTGEVTTSAVPADTKLFYDSFLMNCNRAGTSFVDLFRTGFQNALLFRSAYVLVDLPTSQPFANLYEQQQSGALNPYLGIYSPLDVINWQLDSFGNLDWLIIKVTSRRATAKQVPKVVDQWFYYDRKTFEVWEREHDEEEKVAPDKATAKLVSSGQHSLAKFNEVPVQRFQLPEGLWLANRAMLAAIAHLNTDNVLQWALSMAGLAMPVIMADGDISFNLSEVGVLQLPKDSKYEWTEPEGTSWEHLAARLDTLTENIFRSFYLIHQGRSGRATPTAQSGISKQMDMMPSKDILKMFGDMLRAFMQRVLNMVARAHNDSEKFEWDVRGFEFKDDLSLTEVQALTEILQMDIPSSRFVKEIEKRVARAGVPDANPSIQRQIFKEIDDSPDRQDRQMDSLKQKASILGADKPPTISQAAKDDKGTGADAGPAD